MRTGRNDRPNDLTNVFIIVHLCFLQPSGYVASDGFDCTMQEESFPSKLEKLKGKKIKNNHVALQSRTTTCSVTSSAYGATDAFTREVQKGKLPTLFPLQAFMHWFGRNIV